MSSPYIVYLYLHFNGYMKMCLFPEFPEHYLHESRRYNFNQNHLNSFCDFVYS